MDMPACYDEWKTSNPERRDPASDRINAEISRTCGLLRPLCDVDCGLDDSDGETVCEWTIRFSVRGDEIESGLALKLVELLATLNEHRRRYVLGGSR